MNMHQRRIYYWLWLGIVMIFIMVIIGGITRLTGSGLSMVNWNPIMGSIPPLNNTEWNAVFNLYKQSPEYIKVNYEMSLMEFQKIFFWEYVHRMWGRLLGIVFLVPFIYFLVKGKLEKKQMKHLVVILLLGASQALMGWVMVKSGLVDQPEVSHYRLTAHLLLAILLIAYIYALAYSINSSRQLSLNRSLSSYMKKWSIGVLFLLLIQIIYGGFMAGKKASLFYNTYPLMVGKWLPDNLFVYNSFQGNLLENITYINFFHRHFPLLILVTILAFVFQVYKTLDLRRIFFKNVTWLTFTILVQITLGILTLVQTIGKIPVYWGVIHQIWGIIVFLSAFHLFLKVRKRSL